MAIQIIYGCPGNNMTFSRVVDMSTEAPADRVSVKAVSGSFDSVSDYLPEEKAVYGLSRIVSEFGADHGGADRIPCPS